MKSVPAWTRGDLTGVLDAGTNPTSLRAAVAVVRSVADYHTLTTPAVTVGPGIPSSTEEGSLFSREFFMPRYGAAFDEKRPPLDKGRLQGGF